VLNDTFPGVAGWLFFPTGFGFHVANGQPTPSVNMVVIDRGHSDLGSAERSAVDICTNDVVWDGEKTTYSEYQSSGSSGDHHGKAAVVANIAKTVWE
jgi:hypothetical protein